MEAWIHLQCWYLVSCRSRVFTEMIARQLARTRPQGLIQPPVALGDAPRAPLAQRSPDCARVAVCTTKV